MAEPINVYQSAPSVPTSVAAAAQMLHGWVDIALYGSLAMPATCPRCGVMAASITVGRAQSPWFRIEPCGCLFEVNRG